ncbi:hypothetical protein B0J13DRAFT_550614, partial [Dactylonectria estremocensis]
MLRWIASCPPFCLWELSRCSIMTAQDMTSTRQRQYETNTPDTTRPVVLNRDTIFVHRYERYRIHPSETTRTRRERSARRSSPPPNSSRGVS